MFEAGGDGAEENQGEELLRHPKNKGISRRVRSTGSNFAKRTNKRRFEKCPSTVAAWGEEEAVVDGI